ncbi:MAG TPA: TrkH family potassium uptake protein [Rubrobacter sp.]|nr:TrkH family potassium uptake protein [Rubrobacter sp.]
MNPRVVIRVNAGVILAIGLALLVPLALSVLYRDGSWASFLLPAALMVATGIVSFRLSRPRGRAPEYVSNRDVYLSVTLAWTLAALLGGTPFLVEGTFHSLLDSSFEAMSGFTTTGATLLSDIEAQTPSILFWRSMTHWLGGIGIVVLFVAVAPLLGVGTARLIGAEMSGLTQPRLTPRIADTAKALVIIYLAISAAETVALLLARMPLYDAVVHTFGTVATGGFSHKTASVGFYDSLAIEAIIGFFMVASGVSFSLYYLLYTRRRLDVLLDRELLAYLAIIAAAALFIWGILVLEGDYGDSWGRALRDSAFTASSIITTTGFITADFDQWDAAAEIILILLMFIGGCAGSTAGGIKVIRILIIFRTILQDVFRMIHPRAHTASARRTRGSRGRADRRPRALRGLDRGLRDSDFPRCPPGRADPALFRYRGSGHPERRRPWPGTGRSHGELRDSRPSGPLRTHRLYAPGEAGDLHRPGTPLPRILASLSVVGAGFKPAPTFNVLVAGRLFCVP